MRIRNTGCTYNKSCHIFIPKSEKTTGSSVKLSKIVQYIFDGHVFAQKVKAQAVTTSKWEREEADDLMKARKALMGAVASKWEDQEEGEDSLDGEPMGGRGGEALAPIDARAEEERRQILR